jgi:hypothetical protein
LKLIIFVGMFSEQLVYGRGGQSCGKEHWAGDSIVCFFGTHFCPSSTRMHVLVMKLPSVVHGNTHQVFHVTRYSTPFRLDAKTSLSDFVLRILIVYGLDTSVLFTKFKIYGLVTEAMCDYKKGTAYRLYVLYKFEW